jgi:lipoate-protein ligase A
MGARKFGGNAQAITSRRWLHHTSFLWDFDPGNMALLTNPAKQPEYRQVGTEPRLRVPSGLARGRGRGALVARTPPTLVPL